MCEIVKLKVEHVAELVREPSNAHLGHWITSGHAKDLVEAAESAAGIVNGKVMFCGGALPYWRNRAYIWAVFSQESKHYGVSVFRSIKRWLDERSYGRLEVDVPLDLDYSNQAERRVEMLGFKMECMRAKHFRSNGKDSALYSRIKESVYG